jgi:hypothetical protein
MRGNKKIILISILLLIIGAILLNSNYMIGLNENFIERDARESQKINKDWLNVKETNNRMSALLFYDEAIKEHTFSIYLNKPGFSYGYTFKHGGSSSTIDSGIKGYSYGAYGMVLMSMNTKKVSQIKLENKETLEIINLDPIKPFVILVPETVEKVSLFDVEGNDIPIDNIEHY